MRLKLIIGILICLISLTGTALAVDFYAVLDQPNDDSPGAENIQKITASVSGNVVTFNATGLNNAPNGWFKVVGLPTGVTVLSVTDEYGTSVTDYSVSNAQIDGFKYDGKKIIFSTATFNDQISSDDQDRFSEVHVTFSGPFVDPVIFGAEVAWGTPIGDYDLSSAKYMGYGTITEVPEFPTIAAPVAAILGLMFIFGRRKQE